MSVMPARSITESTDAWWTKREPVSSSVSRTVMSLSSPAVCMTAATRPREIALRGDWPSTLTVPAVGSDSPRIMSMVVVFPAPLGPRKATISPGWISRSMPRTACTDPKSLRSPTAEIAATPPSTPWARPWTAVDVGVVVMSSRMAWPPSARPAPSSRLTHDGCHPSAVQRPPDEFVRVRPPHGYAPS